MNKQLIVSIGLIERKGRFLMTRRISSNPEWHNRWEFPGGKIEPGETPEEALHREIYEETSLQVEFPRLLGVHTLHWKVPSGTQQTFLLLYHCHALEGEVILNPEENDAYLWEPIEEIMQRDDLINGTREMLKALFISQPTSLIQA